MIRLAVRGVLPRQYIRPVSLNRMCDLGGCVPISPHELRLRTEGEVQNVVEHENLPITAGAGADANRRRGNLRRNHLRHFARNAFEVNAGDSATFERSSIAHELLDV